MMAGWEGINVHLVRMLRVCASFRQAGANCYVCRWALMNSMLSYDQVGASNNIAVPNGCVTHLPTPVVTPLAIQMDLV